MRRIHVALVLDPVYGCASDEVLMIKLKIDESHDPLEFIVADALWLRLQFVANRNPTITRRTLDD